MQFTNIAENALMVKLGETIDISTHKQLITLQQLINTSRRCGLIEAVIGFTTLTVYFDPLVTSHSDVKKLVINLNTHNNEKVFTPVIHHIPVCYDELYSPDINYVADYHQLSVEKVIELHISATYTVYFIGFSPGFPFLGGMSGKLATPRKSAPRPVIPAGSVGIAGKQTGIYPSQSPGGWQIIGRTPIKLVQLNQKRPTLLQPGDQIRFYRIKSEEFMQLANGEGL
ncbi:inhibitor of KinA [Gracilibacillus ureilyticus]|uniref:Inhibitor of KinA n=1 Tax=Gracilibacillus ureilyticus TaxID=531814 RepID=A0A1H9PUZ5_9BACI|nr:5-oxoprolinase subunit PxpB [Gracilibacillus ureilyticus]SER52106.1 inhibitor of KinA [Gracilibacillus ureilyticus]